jgi:hypothetical protein
VTNYPLFHLSEDHYQAEIALSVLMCFGSPQEKKLLKPQAARLRVDYIKGNNGMNLFECVANIIKAYIEEHGQLSDLLQTYLNKSPKLLAQVMQPE